MLQALAALIGAVSVAAGAYGAHGAQGDAARGDPLGIAQGLRPVQRGDGEVRRIASRLSDVPGDPLLDDCQPPAYTIP